MDCNCTNFNSCGGIKSGTTSEKNKNFRVTAAFNSYEDLSAPERGFNFHESKCRDYKMEVEKTVKEPDPYHPKVLSLLHESKDSSLHPPDPFAQLDPKDYELDTSPIGLPVEKPACYLPQENDDHVIVPSAQGLMGPLGPYATGRVDWSPLAGLTGTRPVVDSYSITRHSTNEWRRRNYGTLQAANEVIQKSIEVENSAKNTIAKSYEVTDHNQTCNTRRLQNRTKDIDDWKQCLERAIRGMTDEICTLEEQRRRLKQAMNVLQMPESIVSECLSTRTRRPEPELIRDEPEEELIKEKALIAEIRALFIKTLSEIEAQLKDNRTNKMRLEYDWSDKKDAHENDSRNSQLSNRAQAIMFKAGATRFPTEQSTENHWEEFTVQNLNLAEKCRQLSIKLRSTLDAILMNSARDLRTQADNVDRAMHNRIICMDEIRQRLENELRVCLRRLADTEVQIEKLHISIQNMDFPMKVAQTRLDNRHERPRVENCRDESQFALVGEVRSVHDSMTILNEELRKSQEVKKNLMIQRGNLEREIMLKRRTINVDKDRIQLIRTHFPSTTAMTGY